MKRLCCAVRRIAPLFILLLNPAYTTAAEQAKTFAYLKTGLNELNQSERIVGLQMWADEIAANNKSKIEIRAINSIDDMITAAKNKQLNFALFNTGAYLKNYRRLQPYLAPETFAIQRSDELYENYVIVVKNSSAIDSFSALRNKRFALAGEHILFNDYLEYIVKTSGGLRAARFFKQISHPPTSTQAILNVFFGVADACLTPLHVFNLTGEMNPAIFEKLKIIHSSGPIFIPAVVVVFNNTSDEGRKIFKHILLDEAIDIHKRQFLDSFKVNRIVLVEPANFQSMLKIYE
jgi:ABC-type phosphate/phosphonate transport system substrate-binding protein